MIVPANSPAALAIVVSVKTGLASHRPDIWRLACPFMQICHEAR